MKLDRASQVCPEYLLETDTLPKAFMMLAQMPQGSPDARSWGWTSCSAPGI